LSCRGRIGYFFLQCLSLCAGRLVQLVRIIIGQRWPQRELARISVAPDPLFAQPVFQAFAPPLQRAMDRRR
jgi:hypothetical protein